MFLLRYQDNLLYLPRSPAIAAALGPDERDGTWYLIRADLPAAAFSHQRQLLAGIPGHAADGECGSCPVQTVAAGDFQMVLGKCAVLGANVSPRVVPDTRVAMSRMPQYNRIIGHGSWDIPPAEASGAET